MQQCRWVEFLHKFTFEIKLTPRKENQATNALSRRMVALAISLANSTLPKEIQQEVLLDEFFGPLIDEIEGQRNSRVLEDYILKEGLLFFRNRLCIPSKLRNHILKEAHESPLATHPRYQKMLLLLKEILLAKNEERCIRILQAMFDMPKS